MGSESPVPQAGSQNKPSGDFAGGPVVKTLGFHCRGCGFDSWLGN